MLNPFRTYKGLPKSMYILFSAQIVNRFGDFVVPFLTLYLTGKLGLSSEITGIIVMTCSLLHIPGSLLGGKCADHIGRRTTYIVAQTLAGLSLLICAFMNKEGLIIACLFLSTFFNGAVRPTMNAIVADLLPPEKRKLGYSLLYLGTNFGVSLGPMVAGFLFNNYLHFLFIGDALTSFIAVTLVSIFVHETNPLSTRENEIEGHEAKEEVEESGNVFNVLIKKPQIILFLLISIIYSFVYTQHRFSLPLMMDYVFKMDGAENFGYLMSINAFTVISMTIFMTDITKRFKPLTNMIIAGILYAVGFGMIGMVKIFPLFLVSTIIWTLGEILVVTNFGVYIANNSPQNFRGRFSSISTLSWATGNALGTSLMGKYIGVFGISSVWPLIFVLSVVSSILMYFLYLYAYKKSSKAVFIRE